MMEEVVRIHLKKKEEKCKEIKSKILSLRKEPKKIDIKLNIILKLENSIEILHDIINCQISPFIKTDLRYDVVLASLPTHCLATTREVLFVASGAHTIFPEEVPTIGCSNYIDEFIVPHMENFEHTNDIVIDMSGFYTPVIKHDPESTSSNHPTKKYVPYYLLKWILDTERGGESVSQNFGQFFTFYKLIEQHKFISFSQPIYKRINTLFIYLT
jgi:hypothetical protein